MKKILALCFVLSAFCIASEFSYGFASGTANFNAFSYHPQNMAQLGIFGEDVQEITDYHRIGALANWPMGIISGNFLFEYTTLDSIYQRIRSKIGISITRNFFGGGVSHLMNIEIAKNEETWNNHGFLLHGHLFWNFFFCSGGGGILPNKELFFYSTIALNFENYKIYLEFIQEEKKFFQIGHLFKMGVLGVETAYRYPFASFYIGLSFSMDSWKLSLGKKGVTRYYSKNYWNISKKFQ